jgi:hypothetical protein
VTEFGDLKRVDLRELWPHEAIDFTPWLSENISMLSNTLGLDLEIIGRETPVGDFSCDLFAKDLGSGRSVVIENQLECTNHDHLGKLVTYAAGHEAGILIWVAKEIRDEHRQSLAWLNTRTHANTDFFAVVVEAIRIDDSRPAFNFRVVVSPNEWQKRVLEREVRTPSIRQEQYREFFQSLIDTLREKYCFTNSRTAQPQNWFTFSTGVKGVVYGFTFARNRIRVELYIDFSDVEKNKRFFDALFLRKEEIEKKYGQPLQWERLDERRASRIAIYEDGTIDSDPVQLAEFKEWGIRHLLQFKDIFGPLLKELSRDVFREEESGLMA